MKLKKIVKFLFCLCLIGAIALFSINARVKTVTDSKIISVEESAKLEDIDCIIVLGCQVKSDGSLSHMLRDRLMRGVELYKQTTAPKIIMSGDHGQKSYDEVNAMKQYAIENGVPSEDVFMDHAGFSTYESMYRARDIFKAKKVLIVTQEYHLYRAIYVARKLGLDAYGVTSDLRDYGGQDFRDIREILARNKDFFFTVF